MTQDEVCSLYCVPAAKIAANFIVPGMEREDITQEAIIKLLELADHPRISDPGFAALTTRNHLIDLQRRATFLPMDSLETPIGNSEDGNVLTLGATLFDDRPSPLDVAIDDEFCAIVQSAVESLPKELDRQVVEIHTGINQLRGEAKSLRQTAKVLSISPDRAERAWKRSLETLHDNEILMEMAA